MRERYPELIEEVRTKGMDYEDFLLRLIEIEDAGKKERRQAKLKADAHFETERHLEDIDYSFNPSLDRGMIDELSRLDFIEACENVLIIGPPGVGKSSLMEQYGVTTQELHDIAFQNLSESQIEFKTMRDVLVDMMFPDGIQEGDPRAFMLPPEEENPSMYVLSNADKLNGAAALLDAKTMEDISEKLGGDFIVLPSSVHETIVLPLNEDMDRHTLEAMVQDVNAEQVAPEERLSDHVYMYDSQEKELVLAGKMEERQQQRAEAQKDAKEAEQEDKPGKAERGEKKPERERVSIKEKLPEKKAEVAKNEANREHPVPTKTKETALG